MKPASPHFTELGAAQLRQYIDAEAVFSALEEATQDAREVRGSMFWRQQGGGTYLIRTSGSGAQTSLGPRSEENLAIHARFTERKRVAQERVKNLRTALQQQQRLNRALRVGRAPPIVTETLDAIAKAGLDAHFLVVGTHALFAYEAAAGAMVESGATATQDVDLLFDTRRRLSFWSQLKRLDSSFLSVLRGADKSFRVRSGQRYTVVNDAGFEVDVVRRIQVEGDPHPLRLSEDVEDIWPVQVATGQDLLNAGRFSRMVVSTSGTMARMNTVDPRAFIRVKRWLAAQKDRDPLKRRKDALQADIVASLVETYLPQLDAQL
jgi:hypothetical protein